MPKFKMQVLTGGNGAGAAITATAEPAVTWSPTFLNN